MTGYSPAGNTENPKPKRNLKWLGLGMALFPFALADVVLFREGFFFALGFNVTLAFVFGGIYLFARD
jgi:hypothetical protein